MRGDWILVGNEIRRLCLRAPGGIQRAEVGGRQGEWRTPLHQAEPASSTGSRPNLPIFNRSRCRGTALAPSSPEVIRMGWPTESARDGPSRKPGWRARRGHPRLVRHGRGVASGGWPLSLQLNRVAELSTPIPGGSAGTSPYSRRTHEGTNDTGDLS